MKGRSEGEANREVMVSKEDEVEKLRGGEVEKVRRGL